MVTRVASVDAVVKIRGVRIGGSGSYA